MKVEINESWKNALEPEFEKHYFLNLVNFVKQEYKEYSIFPSEQLIFSAFDHCPLDNVKVVIIGQDPYHGVGQANGLCFSVSNGVRKPPSLLNIFKELQNDLNITIPESGNLERWADQGVLLLNATLTVRAKEPGSHQNKGWEEFTDAIIQLLSDNKKDVVFILWGSYAQKKGGIIDKQKHYIIESAHPSPFAAHRGFFGSQPFSKTNLYLEGLGKTKINW